MSAYENLPVDLSTFLTHTIVSSTLKGLTMIFAGQENPYIIFRSKEIYIYFKRSNKYPHKFAEIMKKNMVFGKFHSCGHSNSVFYFLKF